MWYLSLLVLFDKNFKYELYLSNGCHDLMQKGMNFNDVAIVSVKGSYYRINFKYMSKDDAINVMNNSNVDEKNGMLYFFLIIYKNERKNLPSKKQRCDTK